MKGFMVVYSQHGDEVFLTIATSSGVRCTVIEKGFKATVFRTKRAAQKAIAAAKASAVYRHECGRWEIDFDLIESPHNFHIVEVEILGKGAL